MGKNFFVILIFVLAVNLTSMASNPIPSIKAKLYELSMDRMYRDEDFTDFKSDETFKLLNSSGYWTDINYEGTTRSSWEPIEHWKRLFELSFLYQNKGGAYYRNKSLKKKIIKAISFWMEKKPVAGNFWWDAIGAPLAMGKVFILMEDELPDHLIKQGIQIMNLSIKDDFYDYHGVATGQNLLWLAYVHIYTSCLANDLAGVKRAFSESAKEMRITEEEGIQADYSFHQHGPQFYSFGYGKTFSITVAHLIYLAQGTPFQFPKSKIDIISHFILDGQRWASRNQFLEYTGKGREISRNTLDLNSLLYAIRLMAIIDSDRKSEFEAFLKQLESTTTLNPLIGNRYFNRSDFMVQQRKDFYFSIKGASKRIYASESGNGENLKGFYQGHGTYYIVQKGDEYKDILPLLNWKQLPGSLVEQDTLELPLIDWGHKNSGNTDFVYGVSDSLNGSFGYDYIKGNVQAKRSWFLFDDTIVCLVGGLNFNSNNNLFQSVNQTVTKGDVWINDQKMIGSEYSDKNIEKVYHDSVGYIFEPSSVYEKQIKASMKTGSWSEINNAGSTNSFSKKVFSLNINLGGQLNNQSFMYAILPGIENDKFKTYKLDDHINVLQNDTNIQAVFQKNMQQVQAVFYAPGVLQLPWGNQQLVLHKPGMVMVKKINNQLVINMNPQLDSTVYKIDLNKNFKLENQLLEIVFK